MEIDNKGQIHILSNRKTLCELDFEHINIGEESEELRANLILYTFDIPRFKLTDEEIDSAILALHALSYKLKVYREKKILI